MSNNPLEAVTQAVNSLVTALKLPDESAKANEVLGESKRLVRTVLIFTESSDQLSRATDRVPGLPASP